MGQNIHVIDQEMVDVFKDMIMGGNDGDIKLALEILDNRDKTNVESESQYERLMDLIINDEVLFPSHPLYYLKIKNKVLTVKGRSVFNSEIEAKKFLSYHLTKMIGVEHSFKIIKNPYLKAIKEVFKSGIKLRDFLIKNNLVEVVKIENGKLS